MIANKIFASPKALTVHFLVLGFLCAFWQSCLLRGLMSLGKGHVCHELQHVPYMWAAVFFLVPRHGCVLSFRDPALLVCSVNFFQFRHFVWGPKKPKPPNASIIDRIVSFVRCAAWASAVLPIICHAVACAGPKCPADVIPVLWVGRRAVRPVPIARAYVCGL